MRTDIRYPMARILKAIADDMSYNFGEEGYRYFRNATAESLVRHYGKTMDNKATNDKSFFHLYEIGHRGSARHRLFKMIRKEGRFAVALKPAKMLVPLSEDQKTPGPTGRRVTRRYRFPARPWVFEYGKTVVIKRNPPTKFMWPAGTDVSSRPAPRPPLRGPVVIRVNPIYKFKLRKETKAYFKHEGRMHMSERARKYARQSIKSAAKAGKRAEFA